MTSSIFANVKLAPRDPIFGLNEAFVTDTRAEKVNLGVGVYFDDNGKIPLLGAVEAAEAAILKTSPARGYQPIEGPKVYGDAVQGLIFGPASALVAAGRAITCEAIGGTGALKVGADFLHRINPDAKVYISTPSWENHRALFEAAGFTVESYPYYDAATRGVDFDAMLASLKAAAAGSIIVLHACCHNPTGADLTAEQWAKVVEAVREGKLVAFLDMAYQGFADGIEPDGAAVRLFADSGLEFFISSSFSKSFSLYGERVGALTIVTANREESFARAVASQTRHSHQLLATPRFTAARSSPRCSPARHCVASGKTNWRACANAFATCAPRSSRASRRPAQNRISRSSSVSAACFPIPG